MNNIWTIAAREFKKYFASPAAFIILFIILLVVGIFFYLSLNVAFQQSQYIPGIDNVTGLLPTLMRLATPAITARLLADERKLGTIELLLTSPVRDWELVIGKWLGSYLFMLAVMGITLIYPLILHQMVDPGIDQGPFISGYLGLALLVAAMLAIGVFVSSLFSNQIAAFITTLGILILMWWILAPVSQSNFLGSGAELVRYLDINAHFYENFFRGVIDLRDMIYYLSVTAMGLFFGTVSIGLRRWQL